MWHNLSLPNIYSHVVTQKVKLLLRFHTTKVASRMFQKIQRCRNRRKCVILVGTFQQRNTVTTCASINRKLGGILQSLVLISQKRKCIEYNLIQLTLALVMLLVVNLCLPQMIAGPFNAIISQVLAFSMDFPYWPDCLSFEAGLHYWISWMFG